MSLSYPRIQQYRRMIASARDAAGGLIVFAVAVVVFFRVSPILAVVGVAVAALLAIRARRSLSLAGCSRVGADSEEEVSDALAVLRRQGWSVRTGVVLPWGGDIDQLVVVPAGVGFVVETRTARFSEEHLAHTRRAARWAAGRERECPLGVIPVVCLVRSRGLEHFYGEVLVVSLDRLLPALRSAAIASRSGLRIHTAPAVTASMASGGLLCR